MQIAAEAVVFHFHREIATRGHDEPGLGRDVALAADAAEAPRFERAEENGLQLERQRAHFTKQQRPLTRQLQAAAEAAAGVGQRTPFDAEEARFQRDRVGAGTPRLEERLPRARTEVVNEPGDPRLPDARSPWMRTVVRSLCASATICCPTARIAAEVPSASSETPGADSDASAARRRRVAIGHARRGRGQELEARPADQDVIRAAAERLGRGAVVGRVEHADHGNAALAEQGEEVGPVAGRHAEIEHRDIGLEPVARGQGSGGVQLPRHLEALLLQVSADGAQCHRVVINQQNRIAHRISPPSTLVPPRKLPPEPPRR